MRDACNVQAREGLRGYLITVPRYIAKTIVAAVNESLKSKGKAKLTQEAAKRLASQLQVVLWPICGLVTISVGERFPQDLQFYGV